MILGYPRPKAAGPKGTGLSLTEWLEVATAGLTAPAREKIEREISAHYLDAVEAHRANGESDKTAHAGALAELGDLEKAGVKFRKQYLTEGDLAVMRRAHATALKPWNNTSVLIGLIAFAVIFVTDVSATDSLDDPIGSFFARHSEMRLALVFVIFLITSVLTPVMSFRLAKRSSMELTARTLLNRERYRDLLTSMTAYFLWACIRPAREMVFVLAIFWMQPSQDVLAKLHKKAKADAGGSLTS